MDSSYVECINSLSWYIFTVFGTIISWKETLHKIVVSINHWSRIHCPCSNYQISILLKDFAKELKLQNQVIIVHYDSQSVIHMSKNSSYHEWTKHIDVKLCFVREIIKRGEVKLSIDHNATNMTTKPLRSCNFFHCLQLINQYDDCWSLYLLEFVLSWSFIA